MAPGDSPRSFPRSFICGSSLAMSLSSAQFGATASTKVLDANLMHISTPEYVLIHILGSPWCIRRNLGGRRFGETRFSAVHVVSPRLGVATGRGTRDSGI